MQRLRPAADHRVGALPDLEATGLGRLQTYAQVTRIITGTGMAAETDHGENIARLEQPLDITVGVANLERRKRCDRVGGCRFSHAHGAVRSLLSQEGRPRMIHCAAKNH